MKIYMHIPYIALDIYAFCIYICIVFRYLLKYNNKYHKVISKFSYIIFRNNNAINELIIRLRN